MRAALFLVLALAALAAAGPLSSAPAGGPLRADATSGPQQGAAPAAATADTPLIVADSTTSTSTSTSTSSSTSSSSSSSSTSSSTTSSTATTSSTTSSTSTSTTSSTSTTTIGDLAPFLVLPDEGIMVRNSSGMTSNVLYCARIVPRLSITSATKLTAGFSGSSSTTCGIAVYDDSDSGTRLATTSGSCPTSAGTYQGTGISGFQLLSGTRYRVCLCVSGGSQAFTGVSDSGNFTPFTKLFTTNAVATAANACSTGAPPSTTGALTGASIIMPVVKVEQ